MFGETGKIRCQLISDVIHIFASIYSSFSLLFAAEDILNGNCGVLFVCYFFNSSTTIG